MRLTSRSHSGLSVLSIILGIVFATAVPFVQASQHENDQRLPVLITQPIDESKLVTLRGNTRPEANAKNDRGPVPDDFPMPHMLLQLKRAPQLEKELEQYIETLTDKSSPNYHHWINAAEQGEKYGPAQEDLDTITGWLSSHGFEVGYVYPNRMVIDFSGTAGQIREAFHTDIHYLEVNGERHFANMSNPQIPKALIPAVVGVVSMNNFKPHPMLVPATDYTFSGCTSTASRPTEPGTCYALVPADFQMIYNLNPLYRLGITGGNSTARQTITLVEDSNTYSTDVATYRSTFLGGFSLGTFSTIHPSTSGQPTCSTPTSTTDDSEADLDAEIASAIAPGANITVASCADATTNGVLIAVQNLVNAASPPSIISMSYGECEALSGATTTAAFNTAFQTGAGAGVSIFASTGDYGAGGCAPGYTTSYAETGIGITGWGESVYNVSVGGTDFEDVYNAKEASPTIPLSTYWNSTNTATYGSAKSYIPEIPWNDSCASVLIANYVRGSFNTYGASGTGMCNTSPYNGTAGYLSALAGAGGPSGCATGQGTDQADYGVVDTDCTGYAKPTWQSGIYGNPADGVRDVPDVSLFAGNGIWGHYAVICFSDTTNGGTSCSGAPSTWSGFGGTSVAAPTMASIQALVNQKWGTAWQGSPRSGNPAPIYYSIAKSEFGSSGNTTCYSVNQTTETRRGLGTSCVFYDIEQGDNDIPCQDNGGISTGCYKPSTYGVLSTQALSTPAAVVTAGSGYANTLSCALGAPSNLNEYCVPAGCLTETLWGGGTQAACSATVTSAAGSLVVSGTVATSWAGITVTVGSTVYTLETTLTGVNQMLLHTSSSSTTNRTDTAKNMEAVINATPSQCADTGCVFSGQTANSAATATETTNTVNLTAVTSGSGGDFTVSSSNTTDITASSTNGGAVSAIAVGVTGQGYAGGTSCTISGGGGSGATCSASPLYTTAPSEYEPAYGATPGWDFATGIGSVNAYNLVFNSAW